MHIRTGDIVEVIAGDDKDVKGKVLHIDREKGKLTVEGVNKVYKHVRRSQRNPQGGRLSKEMPVQISNVLLMCPKCNQGVRTGVKLLDALMEHAQAQERELEQIIGLGRKADLICTLQHIATALLPTQVGTPAEAVGWACFSADIA